MTTTKTRQQKKADKKEMERIHDKIINAELENIGKKIAKINQSVRQLKHMRLNLIRVNDHKLGKSCYDSYGLSMKEDEKKGKRPVILDRGINFGIYSEENRCAFFELYKWKLENNDFKYEIDLKYALNEKNQEVIQIFKESMRELRGKTKEQKQYFKFELFFLLNRYIKEIEPFDNVIYNEQSYPINGIGVKYFKGLFTLSNKLNVEIPVKYIMERRKRI